MIYSMYLIVNTIQNVVPTLIGPKINSRQSVTNCKPFKCFFKKQFLKLKDLLVKILEYTIDLDLRALLIVLI